MPLQTEIMICTCFVDVFVAMFFRFTFCGTFRPNMWLLTQSGESFRRRREERKTCFRPYSRPQRTRLPAQADDWPALRESPRAPCDLVASLVAVERGAGPARVTKTGLPSLIGDRLPEPGGATGPPRYHRLESAVAFLAGVKRFPARTGSGEGERRFAWHTGLWFVSSRPVAGVL